MVFNGLQKSDLIVFNALLKCDLSQEVPISQIERITCLHRRTVTDALQRLARYCIVDRTRDSNGRPYKYTIKDDNYVVLDA